MRALVHAGGARGRGKLVAEALFSQRLAAGAANPSKIADRASILCPLQDLQNRQGYGNRFATLFGAERCNAVAANVPSLACRKGLRPKKLRHESLRHFDVTRIERVSLRQNIS